MALVRIGDAGVDMTRSIFSSFDPFYFTEETASTVSIDYRTSNRRDYAVRVDGVNLNTTTLTGTANRALETVNGVLLFEVTGFSAPISAGFLIGPSQSFPLAQSIILGGDDTIQGGAGNDVLLALSGNNTINGGGGNDTAAYDVSSIVAPSYRFRDEAVVFRAPVKQADLLIGVETLRFTNITVPQASLAAAQPFQYAASYGDLTAKFGTDEVAAWRHFAQTGLAEGRAVTFSGLNYIASYADLRTTYRTDAEAGARHYLASGRTEGRAATFDGQRYIASNPDLIRILPKTTDAGAMHFIAFGAAERRVTATFDPLRYIASNRDLIRAFGINEARGTDHYVASGFAENRPTTAFNPTQYLANYADLRAAFRTDLRAATLHYIQSGAAENRVSTPLA